MIRQREKLKCSSVTAEASADPTGISGSGQPRGVVPNWSKGLGPLFSEAVDHYIQVLPPLFRRWGVTLDEAGSSLLHAIPREELGCEPSIANTHGTWRNEWLAWREGLGSAPQHPLHYKGHRKQKDKWSTQHLRGRYRIRKHRRDQRKNVCI